MAFRIFFRTSLICGLVAGGVVAGAEVQAGPTRDSVNGLGRALDGGTVLIGNQVFKLSGVVAPTLDEFHGPRSRAALDKLIAGKELICTTPDIAPSKNWRCQIEGLDIGEEIIRRGWASSDRTNRFRPDVLSPYDLAEADAIENERGLWSKTMWLWSLLYENVATLITAFITLFAVAFGGLMTYFATVAHDERQRRGEAEDVARALYHEVLNRAGRCWFDYRNPWQYRAFPGHEEMSGERIQKFRPTDPVIYPSMGEKLGLVKGDALANVIKFYSSLDAWGRDMEYWQVRASGTLVGKEDVKMLARRLGETLQPALNALETLGKYVPDHEEIDEQFAATYEDPPVGGFRKDLGEMAAHAKQSKDAEQER